MNISLTDNAKEYFLNILKEQPENTKILLSLTTTGCSGYAYKMDFHKGYVDLDKYEIISYENNLKLIVDTKYQDILNNLEIDYKKQGLNQSLVYINKNEKDRCGCGASFRV